MWVDDQLVKVWLRKKLKPALIILAPTLNGGMWLSNVNSRLWHYLRPGKKYELMRLKATNPSEGEDGLRQQSHHPQDSSKSWWGDYSPREFQRRRKNWWSDSYGDHGDQAPRQVTLDKNSALGQQLPRRQMQNSGWRQDADQSGYYLEDSEFDSVSKFSDHLPSQCY